MTKIFLYSFLLIVSLIGSQFFGGAGADWIKIGTMFCLSGWLVVSIGYGLGGMALTVAVLSLVLNFLLTGFFIIAVKKLITEK
jgi:hypothetical protein